MEKKDEKGSKRIEQDEPMVFKTQPFDGNFGVSASKVGSVTVGTCEPGKSGSLFGDGDL